MHEVKGLRVAIIGAGASGIVAAFQVSKLGEKATIHVFEASSKIGGVWNYKDQVNEIVHGTQLGSFWVIDGDKQPNALYPSLYTNLPHSLMQFRNVPFYDSDENLNRDQVSAENLIDSACELKSGEPSAQSLKHDLFVNHFEVKKYLEKCAKKWGVYSFIKFNHSVTDVVKVNDVWQVSIFDQQEKCLYKEQFNFVLVANGHFSDPIIPEIKGMNMFPHPIIHSQSYRRPEMVRNKAVLVIGVSWSGQDLVREMSHFASTIYWSSRKQYPPEIPKTANHERVQIIGEVIKFNKDGTVETKEGNLYHVAYVYLATGYLYAFPFLKQYTSSSHVPNLEMQMFYKPDPTLMFLGLPRNVIPFPLTEYQAELAAIFINGQVSAGAISQMHDYIQSKIDPMNHIHDFGSGKEFEYCDGISRLTGAPKVPKWKRKLRSEVKQLRIQHLGY